MCDADNLVVTINYENGSVGSMVYTTIGSKTAPKERFEVFGSGRVAFMEDFRELRYVKDGALRKTRSRNQDKGQQRQLEETVARFRSGRSPIELEENLDAMRVAFAAQRSLQENRPVAVRD